MCGGVRHVSTQRSSRIAGRPSAEHPTMQTNASTPIAAENWFESHILRPWVPSALVILPLAALRFFAHLCIQWAAALAYYTLIGLVPLLAAIFAIIKTLGLHRQLTPFVISTIGAGSPEVAREMVELHRRDQRARRVRARRARRPARGDRHHEQRRALPQSHLGRRARGAPGAASSAPSPSSR